VRLTDQAIAKVASQVQGVAPRVASVLVLGVVAPAPLHDELVFCVRSTDPLRRRSRTQTARSPLLT
jgi:hypothetical protein